MAKGRDARRAVGAAVRAHRKDAGMNMQALARRCRISQAQISRLETGHQGWRLETLQRVCKALNVRVAAVLITAGL